MKALTKVYYYSLWAVTIAGIGALGWALFFCWGQSYSDFSTALLTAVDKLDWRDYFEKSVMPLARFQVARWTLLFLSLFYGLFLFLSYRKWPQAANILAKHSKYFYQSFLQSWKGLQPWQIIAVATLAVLFLGRTIWHIEYYALEYDEAWTYNHFTSKGALISMISPNNNHIFYTILASWADILPISTKWAIRLPALLAGALSFSFFFILIRKNFGATTAILALTYFAFSSGMNFYALLGRGYGWQFVFGLLAVIALQQILMGEKEGRWKFLYLVALVLGMYSNPTFLYLGAGLSIFYFCLILKQSVELWSFMKLHFFLLMILLVLHLPLLLTNGMSFLLDATSTGAQASNASMLYYLHRVVDWIFWGRGSLLFWAYLLILFALGGLILSLKWTKRQQLLLGIAYLQLLLPFVYILMSWTQPPYRIWVYLIIFVGCVIAALLHQLRELRLALLLSLCFLLTAGSFYASETHYFLNWSANFDKDAKKMANLLLEYEALENCYSLQHPIRPHHIAADQKLDNLCLP